MLCLVVFGSAELKTAVASIQSKSKTGITGKRPGSKVSTPKTKNKLSRKKRGVSVKPTCDPMPPVNKAACRSEVALLPLIEKAKSLLRQEHVAYAPGSRKGAERRDVKLALANIKTGTLKIVSGRISGKTLYLNDTALRFEVEWWNGFNSSITILEPANTAVIAVLYSLEPKRQRLYGRNGIIYTPYSSALLQPELVEAGKQYLMKKISQAHTELLTVKSQAYSYKSLAQSPFFTREDYFNIIAAEQMDPERFCCIVTDAHKLTSWQQEKLKLLAERILVIVGTNQEDAYSFTGNYAGAHGLTQFTAGAMETVWDNYPDSGIIRNFRKATASHNNAIKAEICLLDFYLAELCDNYPKLRGSGYEKYAAAAAYNGGPGRVHYGLEHFGIQWLNPWRRLSQLSAKPHLTYIEQNEYQWLKHNQYHETFIYLMKLHSIEQLQKDLTPTPVPITSAQQVTSGTKAIIE